MLADLLIDDLLQLPLSDQLVAPRAEVHARLVRVAVGKERADLARRQSAAGRDFIGRRLLGECVGGCQKEQSEGKLSHCAPG